jgi:hypothetical protein
MALTADKDYWPNQLIYRNIPGFLAQFGVPVGFRFGYGSCTQIAPSAGALTTTVASFESAFLLWLRLTPYSIESRVPPSLSLSLSLSLSRIPSGRAGNISRLDLWLPGPSRRFQALGIRAKTQGRCAPPTVRPLPTPTAEWLLAVPGTGSTGSTAPRASSLDANHSTPGTLVAPSLHTELGGYGEAMQPPCRIGSAVSDWFQGIIWCWVSPLHALARRPNVTHTAWH